MAKRWLFMAVIVFTAWHFFILCIYILCLLVLWFFWVHGLGTLLCHRQIVYIFTLLHFIVHFIDIQRSTTCVFSSLLHDSLKSNFCGFLIWIACGAISLVRNLHFTMFAPRSFFWEAHQIDAYFVSQPLCNLQINLMHLPCRLFLHDLSSFVLLFSCFNMWIFV